MDINSMSPMSGRLLDEDGGVVNIVDLLNANAAPVSGAVHDINSYAPRSGRVIGEDGLLYNLVDLLAGIGNGGGPAPALPERIRIEATGENTLTVYRDDVSTAIGAANLDTGSFTVGADYAICLDDLGDVTISLNNALPHRKIGGFHYGANRRTDAALQPIDTLGAVRGTGWEANVYNGILPRSVWTNSHRPKCDPAGMVYLSEGVWVDIYLASVTGAGGLTSKHNATPATGTEGLNWYGFTEKLMLSGKRLLIYNEWIRAAMGSPQGLGGANTNAWSASSTRQLTGYVEWAVSSIGCRDCVGNVWEWLSDLIASGGGTDGWCDAMPGQGFGQLWLFGQENFRALIAGGSYFNAALCGSRTVSTIYPPWDAHPSFGARGACGSIDNG